MSSAASKKCPAAVSSTLITGTQMVSGYVVDVLCTLDVGLDGMKPLNTQPKHIKRYQKHMMSSGRQRQATSILGFHKSPKLVEVAGAYMMLLAVLTMAFTRLPEKTELVTRKASGIKLASVKVPSAQRAAVHVYADCHCFEAACYRC